ncbi:AraC family transcriptional regulator [Yoonia sp. GPGPB17]|uniref:AraC family transcriptional regulator n=1 Tax=Yoonia sp. GPGPB17 TaxID=3026147 RepID=UPI0040409692
MKNQDRNRARIAKALRYIEAHLSAPLRIPDIAKHADLSPFHFQRLFCAYIGETVNRYIIVRLS